MSHVRLHLNCNWGGRYWLFQRNRLGKASDFLTGATHFSCTGDNMAHNCGVWCHDIALAVPIHDCYEMQNTSDCVSNVSVIRLIAYVILSKLLISITHPNINAQLLYYAIDEKALKSYDKYFSPNSSDRRVGHQEYLQGQRFACYILMLDTFLLQLTTHNSPQTKNDSFSLQSMPLTQL